MNKSRFLQELSKIFETKVSEKSSLKDLNFDSLKILDLIALKESKFKNLKINPDEYIRCSNIKDIIKLFRFKK